ncbi:hypothetical protein ACFLR1_02225 [Bacteroidota bacterium]
MVKKLFEIGKRTPSLFGLLFLLLSAASAFGQEVTVGTEFNSSGGLRKKSSEWNTEVFPLKLALMYNNGKTTINGTTMHFLIEPEKNSGLAVEDIKLVIGQGRNWGAVKHDFPQAGAYKITAFDKKKNVLASTTIQITSPAKVVVSKPVEPKPVVIKNIPPKPEPKKPVKPTPVPPKEPKKPVKPVAPAKPIPPAPIEKPKPVKYIKQATTPIVIEGEEELIAEEEDSIYETFYIAFGRGMRNGMLVGQNEKFKLNPQGHYVEVLFSNNLGFNTSQISIDVWHKPTGASDYINHVVEKKISVSNGAIQANFNLTFFKRGQYKVSLYTDKHTWIGSGYMSLY